MNSIRYKLIASLNFNASNLEVKCRLSIDFVIYCKYVDGQYTPAES